MYEYSKTGSTWDGSAVVFARVLRRLDALPSGARVLDAGCGNGHLSTLIASSGFEVIGVDPSETGIRIAAESCPAAHFHCLDLTTGPGPLAEESFDAVAC